MCLMGDENALKSQILLTHYNPTKFTIQPNLEYQNPLLIKIH